MNSRLTIANTKLAIRILAPRPGQALIVNRDAKIPSQTDVNNLTGDCHYLLRERCLTPDTPTPDKKLALIVQSCWVEASIDSNDFSVLNSLQEHWCLCSFKVIPNAELKIYIASRSVYLPFCWQEKRMLETCANLSHANSVKSSDLKWCVCLRALFWVESTLTWLVITTADNISFRGQIQDMLAATTHLDYLFVKHVKSIYSERLATLLESIVS